MKSMYAYLVLICYTGLICTQEAQEKSDQLLSFALFGTMQPLSAEKQYLADRIKKETALAIEGTILDKNSLPTAQNMQEWIDTFIKVYESPFVLSRLTPAEKAQYAQKLSTFFNTIFLKKIDNKNPDNSVTALQEIYDSLPARLKAALRIRLIPVLKTNIHDAELKMLAHQKQINEYELRRLQLQSKLTQATKAPEQAFLQRDYQELEQEMKNAAEIGEENAILLTLYGAFLTVIL